MSKLTLYDIPTKDHTCWSYNPWRTRMVLAYKNIDYKTEWLEYPDIEKALKPHVPQNPPGHTPYTIPTIKLPDGSYIMDTKAIAAHLEKEHPTPSLHLDSSLLPEAVVILGVFHKSLRGIWMPLVPVNLLSEYSSEYFHRTREESVGKSLKQYMAEEGGEEAWIEALPAAVKLGQLLKANGGPFLNGKTPEYADFVVISFLHFFKLIDEKLLFQRVVEVDPAILILYEAGKPWLQRNDH